MTMLAQPFMTDESVLTRPTPGPAGRLQERHGPKVDPRNTRATESLKLRSPAVTHSADLDAQLVSEELALAAIIHSNLMSIRLPSIGYAILDGMTVPCRAIGGDFFDAVALSDSVYAVVADVSGKGMPAAIVAAMLQGIIHAQMLGGEPLEAIAATANQFLCSRAIGKYATMVLLKLRPNGVAEYLNCGHVAPFIVQSDNVRELEGGSTVIGLLPAAEYATQSCRLSPGERIVIFTDGITEAENARGERLEDTQLQFLAQLRGAPTLLEEVSRHQGMSAQNDDLAVFQLEFQGRAS
jgi:phosphoserine phosphatase RsbU/P